MLEAYTISDIHAGFLPFACSCAIVVLCTALFAIVVGLLQTCLLLLAWLWLVLHLLDLLLAQLVLLLLG
jgi:hypothetical protein